MRAKLTLAALMLLPIAILAGCQPKASSASAQHRAQRAFYYWRTTFKLSAVERDALARLGVERLYVRLFEVEWDPKRSAAYPIAPLETSHDQPLPASIAAVPVVFMRNRVFANIAPHAIASLAQTVWRYTSRRAQSLKLNMAELQLDCDWSDATRANYFAFLEHLGQLARSQQVPLSVTIRLHQVKYRERTGVPPADRGMLMFYNMGTFSPQAETSAIFDAAAARRYVARLADYPLPLDVALPLWSWVLHTRDNQIIGLMQNMDPEELERLPWLLPLADGRFTARETTFLHGTLVRQGDVLKPERTTPATTQAAAQLVAPLLPAATGASASRTVALFDLSERNLARHDMASLNHLLALFK